VRKTICMTVVLTAVALSAFAAVYSPVRIALQANVPTIETQLKTSADKDIALSALRAQAADTATKLAAVQGSVENEAFRLFIEKASTVKLRGFGSVRLVPLLDDYLVIIPPALAKNVDIFFAKIRKRVLVGKAATYLICERKYFVPAAPVSPDAALQWGGQP
jgi:hypothetical protein